MANKLSTVTRFSKSPQAIKQEFSQRGSSWGKFAPLEVAERGKIKIPNRLEERLKMMKRGDIDNKPTPRPR